MEIRFKATADTPHYLAELCFTREGDTIVVQVADQKNFEKARYDIPVAAFRAVNTGLDIS